TSSVLFDVDPTLFNALNNEQCCQLYSVSIAIEPSLTESLMDASSAVRGITNKLFPKGSAMNPIKLSEYKNYKEAQKKFKKDVQWHEFLKLDKKQYLNFRPKGKAEEVIKEFNRANSIFPVSEADFILRDWLTSYCNSMDIESSLDQSDTDEMVNNAQDSESTNNINNNADESVHELDTLPTAVSTSSHANVENISIIDNQDVGNFENDGIIYSHENTPTLVKNMSKKRNSAPMRTRNTNTKVIDNQDVENFENDSSQENTSILMKNISKKRNSVPMQSRNTNTKVIDQDVENLETDKQNTVIPEDNASTSLRNNLRSSVQKFNNTESVSEIFEDSAQDSGIKRKREQKLKKTSSHRARA
ncbi:7240_t:CDS:2, partial [Gigaspora rosea]